MDLSKEEIKLIKQHRKENSNKKKRKKKSKVQHTKLILNVLIIAFCLIGLSSVYINYKNGLGMDNIFSNICEVLKWCLPCGFGKSITESYLEKKARIECIDKGINYDEI